VCGVRSRNRALRVFASGLSVTVGASFRIGSSATGFCGGHVITPNSTLAIAIAIAIAITTTVMSTIQYLPRQAMPP
jgi:hypothetical protein